MSIRMVFLCLFLSVPAHAVDFTITTSTTTAARLANDFGCTGTNPQQIQCVTEFIRQLVKAYVKDVEAAASRRQTHSDIDNNVNFQ